MEPVSIHNSLKHYQWGDNCDGWNFVDNDGLSVKQERMPPQTSEQLHYHANAQQFFYILNGTAAFEVDGEDLTIDAGQGVHIDAGRIHRIMNQSNEDLVFILSSQPSTKGDRINVES